MPIVKGVDKLLSILPKKRFGRPNQLGTSQLGFSLYGDDDFYLFFQQLGNAYLGRSEYGDVILLSGIYRIVHTYGHRYICRDSYHFPKNPRSIPQQINRQKMADGIIAWRALSLLEKEEYNHLAIGKHKSGYNLFLTWYLNNN